MKNSPKTIITKLIKDTGKNKINWRVSLRDDFIKCVYIYSITPKKSVIFKLVYYIDDSKMPVLNIILSIEKNDDIDYVSIINLGNNKNEKKLLTQLTNVVISRPDL